jgi:small membrane protein
MLPIQFLLIASLLVAVVITWRRVQGGIIRPIAAVGWTIAWIAAGIVIALPDVTSTIANLVGVGRGVDLVLYAAVIALFFLVFRIFISLDRIEREITEVVRREALGKNGHRASGIGQGEDRTPEKQNNETMEQ